MHGESKKKTIMIVVVNKKVIEKMLQCYVLNNTILLYSLT